MAEISYDPIDEQELFTAASLNNRFSAGGNALQTAINSLDTDALAPGTFSEVHLPSLVLFRGGIGQAAVANAYTYANTPYPGTWAAIDSNGETGGGTPLAQHLGALYNLSSGQAQGIFVMADLYVGRIRRAVGNYTGQTQGVAFRIQAQYGGGWETIARTTRFVAGAILSGAAQDEDRDIDIKVPIRTLIKASDVTNGTINSVRVQISVVDTGGAPQTFVSLKACSLSVIILQSTVV
jgi:hypothetical protein